MFYQIGCLHVQDGLQKFLNHHWQYQKIKKRDFSEFISDSYRQDLTKLEYVSIICDATSLLTSLDFALNVKKSKLEPTTELLVLGFSINSITMKMNFTQTKKDDLKVLLKRTLFKKTTKKTACSVNRNGNLNQICKTYGYDTKNE